MLSKVYLFNYCSTFRSSGCLKFSFFYPAEWRIPTILCVSKGRLKSVHLITVVGEQVPQLSMSFTFILLLFARLRKRNEKLPENEKQLLANLFSNENCLFLDLCFVNKFSNNENGFQLFAVDILVKFWQVLKWLISEFSTLSVIKILIFLSHET